MSVGCYDKVKKHLAHTVVNLRLELALEVINNLFSCFVSTSQNISLYESYVFNFIFMFQK